MDDTLFEAVIEQAPDAIIFADRQGTIRMWNQAAVTLFGHAREDVLGQSLDIIIPERFRRPHWLGFDHAIESGTTKYAGSVMTTRSLHKDGSKLYVDLSFGLVRDASGSVVGALATARRGAAPAPAKEGAAAPDR